MKSLMISKQTFLLFYVCFLFTVSTSYAQTRISTSTSRSSSKFVSQNNNQKLNIEFNGDISIGSDERSISSISRGGYLKIEKTTFGNSRSLFISSSGSGLEYDYREGGSQKPFEPNGKAWLAEILPELLNSTTIGSEDRVNRLYAKGGPKSVFNVTDQMDSDYIKAHYFQLLLEKNLNSSETSQVIDKTISQIDSDHYQTEVFKEIDPSYFKDIDQLTRAVESIDSDHFKTELLKPILSKNNFQGQGQKTVEIINMVDSDHFKSEIAKTIDFSKLNDQELRFMVNEVVPNIDSDHFKSEVLKYIIQTGNMNDDRAILVVLGSEEIDSDHFKAEVLKYICQKQGSEKVKSQIRKTAVDIIDSDHFLGEVLRCAS